MSVVALSPKVGAPSSSFSAHDKTLSSNLNQTQSQSQSQSQSLSQSQANSTYQGASAHTAGSAKFEASGAYEPHFTGTSTAPVQAAPITSLALATHVSQSLHSSPNVSFNASSLAANSLQSSAQTFSATPAAISSTPLFNGTNTATPISSNVAGIDAVKAPLAIADATPVLPTFNGASQALKASPFAESRPQVTLPQTNAPRVNALKDRASLHADASFSLLTGPRSISGVRGGQIAAPVSTPAFSSITSAIGSSLGANALSTTSPSLSVTSSIPADIFTPSSSSIGTSSTELPAFNPSSTGSVSPITPDLAAVFGPQTVFTGAAVVDSSTSNPAGNSSVNNSSGNSGNSGNISSSNSSAASAGTVEQSNSAQAADQSARNEVAQPTVLEQFTQVFGDAKAQVSQVEDPAIASNPDDRQQALADVFAKNDNQLEKQAQEEASQKQQAVAAEQAKQQQSQAQSQAQQAQEQVKQAQEKAQAQQQQQVDSLKARDSEVKAHEHAHATVGGQYAQSPSFKYEKGADGQRYATDGEVQIDVSAVGGDPLATINKMKQVYAAAIAPVDPSSADIRVAAEALQKMNEAKVKLAEERQQQIVDLQTTQTLVGADAQIKALPPLQEHTPVVTGNVDESGNIAQPQNAVSTPVSDAVDKLIQRVEAQRAKTAVTTDTSSNTSSETPSNTSSTSGSVNTPTTVETIEPPTATLAFGEASTAADLATRFIPRPDSTASRYYAAVAQASIGPSVRADVTQQVNIQPSNLAPVNELPNNAQSATVLPTLAAKDTNEINESPSSISASENRSASLQRESSVEDNTSQEAGLIQPQYLGQQPARYVDFSV
ncbi:putative metalloprotease CJM1_0395 family protein [Shewanella baltica]|uniref:Protein-glutamate O-methyltransferase n=1 Tax=Shewanella baltica (strain OS155 / ATCC BAA-1091) TaxID=325240 RepID=A3D468_SHEB5|nr:putative metalloprotease CJM1_0395 family protein [Shewanella baltica]ABN61531.1 protein-glutamate O-methyltransferase [Shewanella baltica OS155]AEH13962.1 protein-glutamate O-methyltransferase [Shewanella baltica OS117]